MSEERLSRLQKWILNKCYGHSWEITNCLGRKREISSGLERRYILSYFLEESLEQNRDYTENKNHPWRTCTWKELFASIEEYNKANVSITRSIKTLSKNGYINLENWHGTSPEIKRKTHKCKIKFIYLTEKGENKAGELLNVK